jgi:hypothetical protein
MRGLGVKKLKDIPAVGPKEPPMVLDRIENHGLRLRVGQLATAQVKPDIGVSAGSVGEKHLIELPHGLFQQPSPLPGQLDPDPRDGELKALRDLSRALGHRQLLLPEATLIRNWQDDQFGWYQRLPCDMALMCQDDIQGR